MPEARTHDLIDHCHQLALSAVQYFVQQPQRADAAETKIVSPHVVSDQQWHTLRVFASWQTDCGI